MARQDYTEHQMALMDLAGEAVVKAYHANDLAAAKEIFAMVPERCRQDLADFTNWLLDQAASKTVH